MTEQKFTYIREITPMMKSVNAQFIILDVGAPRRTKDGHDVRTIKVADRSASINIAVWNELGACLKSGDICRLLNGFVNVHKNTLSLTCGKMGELQKVGEFCMAFSEQPYMSTPNPEYAKYSSDYASKTDGNGGGNGNGGGGGERPTGLAALKHPR